MYNGKVVYDIKVDIFDSNGSLIETYFTNPQTNKPFETIEEAQKFLNNRLKELNTQHTQNKISIYFVDVKSGQKINIGNVGQKVKIILETISNINLPDTLIVPVSNKIGNGDNFLITLTKNRNNKWESKEFLLENA